MHLLPSLSDRGREIENLIYLTTTLKKANHASANINNYTNNNTIPPTTHRVYIVALTSDQYARRQESRLHHPLDAPSKGSNSHKGVDSMTRVTI